MQIEVLGERYQLQDPIGRGGMATIYRGRDIRMDRTVAIKVLREVYSTDPKFVTRFQREAKAASSLQHPNIVQVYDYGQSDGNYFIVMEMVEGADLRRYLRSRGVLAVDRAIIIAHDVALGLGAAHRRSIVHRDVKPQNVLVGRDGSIKLTDFGIASVYKDINAERLTTTGMTLGTVQYYAPEQAQGEIVSPAADVYALGIVMYEMLTGRTPFDGDTPVAVAMQHIQDAPVPPSQMNPNIPPALEEIILRCLEKIPEMRYRDGSTLARALEVLGEEDNATLQAGPISSGNGVVTPPISGPGVAFNQNGALPGGLSPRPMNSSPNQQLGPTPYGGNGAQDGGAATVLHSDQPYAPVSATDNEANTVIEPRPQGMYSGLGEMPPGNDPDATRPFQRDAINNSGARVVNPRRSSRTTGIITALVLLATIVLLGFSIFLATQIGFLPSLFGNHSPQSTPVPQISVPDLVGMSYTDANKAALSAGFTLKIKGSVTNGNVQEQWPKSGSKANAGTSILVQLQAKKLMVPNLLKGITLIEAENQLKAAGITNYQPMSDPTDPIDPGYDANIVTGTTPSAGTTLTDGQVVVIYVVNWDGGTTPTPPPLPTPTPTTPPLPTPTPTTPPLPTPTPTTPPLPTPTPTIPPILTPTATIAASTSGNTGSAPIAEGH
jgi:serine/threonine-protein kinase